VEKKSEYRQGDSAGGQTKVVERQEAKQWNGETNLPEASPSGRVAHKAGSG
jgi:hypothetical protein